MTDLGPVHRPDLHALIFPIETNPATDVGLATAEEFGARRRQERPRPSIVATSPWPSLLRLWHSDVAVETGVGRAGAVRG